MELRIPFVICGLILLAVPDLGAKETIRVPRDAATIQAAIDRSNKGDIIEVSPGIYYESIVLKPNRTVRSVGDNVAGKRGLLRAERTVLDGKQKNQKSGVVMAEGASLDGFTIRNVGFYDEEKWNKHHKSQGNDQDHEHIGRPSISGIRVNNVNCKVVNNIVYHNGYSGIVVSGDNGMPTTPLVTRNICFRNMGAGISLMKHSKATVSENTCYQNFYAGIGHNNASPQVINNDCHSNIRAGIGISNGSCPVVKKNRCYKNRRAGIGTRTGQNTIPLISENDCYQNDMAGIGTEEFAAPIIADNRCFENKLAGIGSRGHSSPTLVGNKCYRNEKSGIGNDGNSNVLVISNHCFENKTSGIGFAHCKEGSALLLNNRFRANSLVAMGVNPGWNVKAIGNYFEREKGMPPLVMVFKDSSVDFVDNEFVGGGVAAIRVAGKIRVELCKLRGTQFRKSGPPNFGIWGLPGAKIEVFETRIENWRSAVSASESSVKLSKSTVSGIHKVAFSLSNPVSGSSVENNRLISNSAEQTVLMTDDLDAIEKRGNSIVPPNNK